MSSYDPSEEKTKRSIKLTPYAISKFTAPILAVVLLFALVYNPFQTWLRGILNPQPAVSLTSSKTLIVGIKPLGELSTVSHQYAKASIEVNLQYGPVCKIYTRHAAQATLKAGIDFDQITEHDVQFNEQTETYTIELPAPRLIDCVFDPFSSEEYSRVGETLVCPADPDEMRMLATHEALTKFTQDALDGGILDDARFQAEIILTNFVQALTGKNVIIRFKPSNQTDLPPSCKSPLGAIWKYDEGSHFWIKQ